jgi:hypothetical protein
MSVVYRRIRRDEIDDLREIHRKEHRYSSFYSKHENWLDRVFAELTDERSRVAFGSFLPNPNNPLDKELLVGGIFVKRPDFSSTAELKGLVVDASRLDSTIEIKAKEIRRNLVLKSVAFCENHEYSQMDSEIPAAFLEEIDIFFECGFQVRSLREKFRPGGYVYILERQIGASYNSDPFDLEKIARWFLRASLGLHECSHPVGLKTISGIQRISRVYSEIRRPFQSNALLSSFPGLKVELLVADIVEAAEVKKRELQDSFESRRSVRYLFTYNQHPEIRELLHEKGIAYISREEIRDEVQNADTSLSIPFERHEIGGVISVLEPAHVKFLKGGNGDFVYFLMSGLGKFIDEETDPSPLLLFYSPFTIGPIKPGIWAAAQITAITHVHFNLAFNYFSDELPKALAKENLMFYRNFSDDDKVLVLKCRNLWQFSKCLSLESIAQRDEAKFLDRQLVKKVASSTYFSSKLRDRIYGIMNDDHALSKVSSIKKQSLDWFGIVVEAAKALPGGDLILGPLIKVRDDQRLSEEIDAKISAIVKQDRNLTSESLRVALASQPSFEEIVKSEQSISLIRDIVNESIRLQKCGEPVTARSLARTYRFSSWPFPDVERADLIRELTALFGTAGQVESFVCAIQAAEYPLNTVDYTNPKKKMIEFVDSLIGQPRSTLKTIFDTLASEKKSSEILKKCAENFS